MPSILAVCAGAEQGAAKKTLERAQVIAGHGLAEDADAGPWHRQVSFLLSDVAVKADGTAVPPGACGENFRVDWVPAEWLHPGTKLKIGRSLVVRITQLGAAPKEGEGCDHVGCGETCVLAARGVFAEVLENGEVAPGDAVRTVVGARGAERREFRSALGMQAAMAALYAVGAWKLVQEDVLGAPGLAVALAVAGACGLASAVSFFGRHRSDFFVRSAPVFWAAAAFLSLFAWLAATGWMSWVAAFALTWTVVGGTAILMALVAAGLGRATDSFVR
jgi:MOSC domain-containing protein YiiM